MRIAPLWRSAASVLLGYLVIVVCTTIGFRPLGGIVHRDAPLTLQAAGALVAVVSGLLGGVMAALVAGHHPVRHAAAVLLLLTIDTAVVLSRGDRDPVWFELAGSATLMLATVGGGVVYSLASRGRRPPRQHSPSGWDPPL